MCFEAALKADGARGGAAEVHFRLGSAWEEKLDLDRALACYCRVVELEPRNGAAWYNRGYIHEEQGQLDDALGCFSEAARLQPDDKLALINIGNVWRQKANEHAAAAAAAVEAAAPPLGGDSGSAARGAANGTREGDGATKNGRAASDGDHTEEEEEQQHARDRELLLHAADYYARAVEVWIRRRRFCGAFEPAGARTAALFACVHG